MRETLPIFPLGLVALPAADVPLQIFEARYRVLFSTLLAGSAGVDEGLVNADKPWAGRRQFGMAFFDQKSQVGGRGVGSAGLGEGTCISGINRRLRRAVALCHPPPPPPNRSPPPLRLQGLAAVGTLLEITEHSNLEDGRMLVNNVGRQRFKILEVCGWLRWVRCGAGPCSIRPHPPTSACPLPCPGRCIHCCCFFLCCCTWFEPQVVEEKPVLVCEVEYLQDDDESGSSAEVCVRRSECVPVGVGHGGGCLCSSTALAAMLPLQRPA